jgi:DNA-binding LacI/PurR family transcriptional regulator
MKDKKITIYDVAKKAGVTTATVSRVLNNKQNVSQDTRTSVLKIINEMEYFPSSVASALSGKKIKEIGIVSPFFLGDFFLKILESLHSNLKDYDVVLYSPQTLVNRKELLNRVISENKISGLIILSSPIFMEDELILKKGNIPIVLLESKHPHFNSVTYDNIFGAYKAVNYLIEQGHKDIGIITGLPEKKILSPIGKERLAGYKLALASAKIHYNEAYVRHSLWTRLDSYKYAKELLSLSKRPTAIFTASDYQALGVLDAAKEFKIKIPEELSVFGFDNTEFSEILSISTVVQKFSVMSHIAVKILLEEIKSGINKNEQVVLQPDLIIRETTGPPV